MILFFVFGNYLDFGNYDTIYTAKWVDLLFVQFILVQPVLIESISSNPNLT